MHASLSSPDGTTMLVDAGDLDTAAMNKALPIKVSPVKPNSSKDRCTVDRELH